MQAEMAAVLYWRLASRRTASLRESGYHCLPRLRIANNFPFTTRQLSLRYTPAHGAAKSQTGTGIGMERVARRAAHSRLRLLRQR